MKLKDSLNMDYRYMNEKGLSYRDWSICENIEFWSQSTESGYTDITRAELGKLFKLSESQMGKIVRELIKKGFLQTNKQHHLKVNEDLAKVMLEAKKAIQKEKEAKQSK